MHCMRHTELRQWLQENTKQGFVNTRLLIHKHVKISVDEWILETTRPQKHVKFLEFYTKDFNK